VFFVKFILQVAVGVCSSEVHYSNQEQDLFYSKIKFTFCFSFQWPKIVKMSIPSLWLEVVRPRAQAEWLVKVLHPMLPTLLLVLKPLLSVKQCLIQLGFCLPSGCYLARSI
jgi:hypothetical protein